MKLQLYLDENYTKEEQLNLTVFDCSDMNLTSLKGIENLINLTYLSCYDNNITDLKLIYRLDKLDKLSTDIKYETIKQLKNDIKIQRRNEFINEILKNF